MTRHAALLCAAALLAAPLAAGASAGLAGEPARMKPQQRAALAKALHLEGVGADALDGVRLLADVPYSRPGEKDLLLDLYLPAASDKPAPCVVVITGGGFRPGARARFGPYAAYLASKGFAAASIDYRGAPQDPFPTAVHDCKAAVRYLRANAARFNIDPQHIGAMGQSAGGHLSAMLATTGGVEELEGDGGNADVSSRVQAAVCFAGVFDFISRLRDGGQQPAKTLEKKRQGNGAWVGEPFSPDSPLWRKASPYYYVDADDPPVLLVHCKGDTTVPFAQSVDMCEALRKHNPASRLLLFEGGSHGITRCAEVNLQAWHETLAFLRQVLGGPQQ